jgi:hypothetical protein
MSYKLTDDDRRDIIDGKKLIRDVIRKIHPQVTVETNNGPTADFRWGVGDGFLLAFDGVIKAALPDW